MATINENSSTQIKAWAIGLDMAYTAGGGLILGAVIDWLAGTRPWFMLGLGLFGLVAGMTRFIREASRLNRAAGKRFETKRGPGGPTGTGGSGPSPGV